MMMDNSAIYLIPTAPTSTAACTVCHFETSVIIVRTLSNQDLADRVAQYGVSFHAYDDDTQLYLHFCRIEIASSVNQLERCVLDIGTGCRRTDWSLYWWDRGTAVLVAIGMLSLGITTCMSWKSADLIGRYYRPSVIGFTLYIIRYAIYTVSK